MKIFRISDTRQRTLDRGPSKRNLRKCMGFFFSLVNYFQLLSRVLINNFKNVN